MNKPPFPSPDERRAEERMNAVERELVDIKSRFDKLLAFVRQDSIAPLKPYESLKREEKRSWSDGSP